MKRCQFGLRLFLLVVALLATCSAWRGALRSQEAYEREIVRSSYESALVAEERWRATLIEDMNRAPIDPQAMPRANGLAELKNIEARMAAVRQELDAMK